MAILEPFSQLLATATHCTAHHSVPLTAREGDGAALDSDGTLHLLRDAPPGLPWAEAAFVKIDPAPFQDLMENAKANERDYQRALAEFKEAGAPLRASAAMWAYLLSLEEVTFGIHLHPLEVCQILCSPRARQFADRRTSPGEVLGAGGSAVLVPYGDPGLEFARDVKRRITLWRGRFKDVQPILYIQNHGVVLLGNEVGPVVNRFEDIARHARVFAGAAALGGPVYLTPTNIEKLQRAYGLPVYGAIAAENSH